MKNKHYVITVNRQFGSLGRPIAKKMASLLGIEYYDRDIVDEAARKLSLPASVVDEKEETAESLTVNPYSRMLFPLGRQNTTSQQDKIFEAQKNIIRFFAEKNSCVIVGRCSDFILYDQENLIRIFIYASYKSRLEHCINQLGISEKDAHDMIISVDKARKAYHLKYAGYEPGDLNHTDIAVNSSLMGVDLTAAFLAKGIEQMLNEKQ